MAADDEDDDIPAVARPDPAELDYDLDAALSALVCVRAETAPDAFTAAALGTDRRGNGVVIGEDGLIVTIGYLVTEAERVWLTSAPEAEGIYARAGFSVVGTAANYDAPAG